MYWQSTDISCICDAAYCWLCSNVDNFCFILDVALLRPWLHAKYNY